MRAEKVLEYIQRVWRRPVVVDTVDQHGAGKTVKVAA
jgi:spore cortex formation protein SpoVR/YcgB (stage V sporulation)